MSEPASPPAPDRKQDFLWRLEALGYDLFAGFFRLFPVDWASAMGGGLLRTLGPLSSAHKTAERNIRLAFPEMTAAERKRLLKAQWDGLGRTFAEFPMMDRIALAPGRIETINPERFEKVAADGRPVVFVSGHFSNWEAMAVAIVRSGVDCYISYRAANNPYVDQRIRDNRARYGIELFAAKGNEGARDLLNAMKAGQSVAFLNDQKFNGGVEAPFFGYEAHTAEGPSRLARRFHTVMQPLSVERIKGARFRVIAHEPIEVPETGDRTADMAAGVRAINAFVEQRVRERPEEWFWVHKRWPKSVYKRLDAKG